jgi:hypothetical protein
VITGRHGTLLAVSLTSGNRHNVTQLTALLDATPRIRDLVGRPRHRPQRLIADRGYHYDTCRHLLRARGITPKIARKGTPHGSSPASARWAIEQTFTRPHRCNTYEPVTKNEPTSTSNCSNSPAASPAHKDPEPHPEMIS